MRGTTADQGLHYNMVEGDGGWSLVRVFALVFVRICGLGEMPTWGDEIKEESASCLCKMTT
jgi:hypothetical protein